MEEHFKVFTQATTALEATGIEYVVFGGIAVWGYGQRRFTKDIDLLLRPADADRALNALTAQGFATVKTDPTWLYKASKDGASVDIVFEVARGYVSCDEVLDRAQRATIDGVELPVISPEDLILVKLAVIKSIRADDWFDCIAVIKGTGGQLDWSYMVEHSRSDPRRLLSLLLFAKTAGCEDEVPDQVIHELAGLVGI